MGVVYEAVDRRTNRPVAIKELPGLSGDRLYRFKQEFRALKDVHHFNLVSLHELYEDAGRWFYTMELVRGRDFVSWVSQRPQQAPGEATLEGAPPLIGERLTGAFKAAARDAAVRPPLDPDFARLKAATLQVTDGVEAIHGAGKLHRDIKPSNILVTDAGRVVILDFGLATELHGEHSASFVGTPSYIAPEVLDGVRGASNDWYSVGVMLFVAVTGRTPFHDDVSWVRSLVARLARPAPPPSEFAAHLPRWIDRLCLGLLDANPSTRWGAAQIRALLGGGRQSQEIVVGHSTGEHPLRHAPLDSGPLPVESGAPESACFVGREDELDRLHDALRVSRHAASVAWVHGSDGLGKSRLLAEFQQQLGRSGLDVLSTRVTPEEHVPYRAMDGLIDALSRRVVPNHTDDRVAGLLVQAAQLFPVLQPRSHTSDVPALDDDSAQARRQGFAALRELLHFASGAAPLTLIIDDWHLADPDSQELLTFLLTGPEPPPILVVLSSAGAPLRSTRGSLAHKLVGGRTVRFIDIELAPLGLTDSGTLAAMLTSGTHTPPDMVAYIAAESGGVPWVIEELAVGLESGDATTPDPSLDHMIARRIERLPASALHLLRIVAVTEPITSSVALALAGSHGAMLRSLCSDHFLRAQDDGQTLTTYHTMVREVCLRSVTADFASRTHLTAADMMLAGDDARPDQIARHLEAAGDDIRAAQYLITAAEAAASQLAFELAANLFERAVARTPDNDRRRPSRMRQWGQALIHGGNGIRGARVLLAAADGLPDVERREAQVTAAVQLVASGADDEGMEIARTALGAHGFRLPSRRAARAQLAWGRARMRFTQPPRKIGGPGCAAEVRQRLDALWKVGSAMSVLDVPTGAALVTSHNESAFRDGGPREISRALAMEAILTGILEHDRGLSQLQQAREIANALKDEYATALADFGHAVLAFNVGDLPNALRAAVASETRLRHAAPGSIWELHNSQAMQLQLLFYLGRLFELGNTGDRLRHDAAHHENPYCLACFQSGWAVQSMLADDDPRLAKEMLASADRNISGDGYVFQALFRVFGRASVAIYADDGPRAYATITAPWQKLKHSGVLNWPFLRDAALDLRGRAALSAGLAGRDHRLLGQARGEASRILNHCRDPWRRTLAGFLRAGALLAEGKDAAGIAELRKAEGAADEARMLAHLHTARFVRGRMTLDDTLIDEAFTALHNLGVASPEKFAKLLLPWG